ncbi:MAG: malectin domain-containing carbohydrate-binding protein, partial [Candidatus Latescibacterota bacterium]
VAADGKLFAVTRDGRVMAFGSARREPLTYSCLPVPSEPSRESIARAQEIISAAGVRDGYSLVYGEKDGNLLEALAGVSDLRMVAVCGDRSRVEALRRQFDRVGLAGGTIAVFAGDFQTFDTPQYMSSLTILNAPILPAGLQKDALNRLFQSLRPYGGTLLLPYSAEAERLVQSLLSGAGFPGAKLKKSGNHLLLVREGPLPGAGVWTHNLGDVANTAKSDDQLVKLPLGILWFGGSSNLDVLPRHGHGPSEQVVGGRLFIEGVNCLNARDVYTGRVLWKAMLHDLDNYEVYYDETYRETPTSTAYNQVHIPGANARGTNFVATEDRVYVVQRDGCHVLDPGTGKTLAVFSLPPDTTRAKGYRPEWGYIGVYRDYLIAGQDFVPFTEILAKGKNERTPFEEFDRVASRSMVVMNRLTGKVLWKVDSRVGFLHNGTAAGNGRLYVLDKYPPHIEDLYTRRGKTAPAPGRLLAFDIATGKVAWEMKENAFGSFLACSEEHDLLIQSMRPSRDMVLGETGKRMMALKGSDGTVAWDKTVEYRTFPIIHNRRIISESGALDLLTGTPVMRTDPLTGADTPWSWRREYGCNYPVASEHLLSFRSGAAGFYDLDGDSGTGNFGGFKSGCTASLIAADGVLNAPDYTRTCSCSYQNQTSLALVSMPRNEMWTYTTLGKPKAPIRQLGINFGAPGDRMANNGALWVEYPPVGGPSPEVAVTVSPETVQYHRLHSSRIGSGDLPWVAASGITGARKITVDLNTSGAYTVRLFFAEPEELRPGQRVFDVSLQGTQALKGFDIAKEAGGTRKALVKEFKNVRVEKDLVIEFTPLGKELPVISGVEVVRE